MQDTTINVDAHESISKTFWRFAIPSVAAMLVSGLYQVIDGIFVGHFIGFEGLAGINMSWPIIGFAMGFGILIGMGSGSTMSIFRGEKDMQGAKATLSSSLWLMVAFGAFSMAILRLFGIDLLTLQGAEGAAFQHGADYIGIFSYGIFFTIAAGAFPMLVRNDDSPKIATALTVIGALLNIALDYLMIGIWDMGLKGAAVATVISQIVVFTIGLGYFLLSFSQIKLDSPTLDLKIAWRITSLGASSLFMFMYFSFIIAIHNKLFMMYGSAVHVGAFAIIGYLATMYYLIAEGIAGGLQPPVSYYFGAKQFTKIQATVKLAFSVIIALGISTVILINLFPIEIIDIFSRGDQQLMDVAKDGIRLHLFALFLDGFLFLASVYFMSVNKGGKALLVSAGNMLVQIPFLFFLPQWLGVNGVWLSLPLSNIILTLAVAPILWKDMKQLGESSPAPAAELAVQQ